MKPTSSEPAWTVGDLARLARVTVRTLHHYDEIGLVRPSAFTESGYRLYGQADLERLHLVRLYRSAGLPLEEIRLILDAPGFDRDAALRAHRERLIAQIDETQQLVTTLDRLLGGEMSHKGLFDGFRHEDHEEEARKRWGHTGSWQISQERTARYGPDDWKRMRAEMEAAHDAYAAAMTAGAPPDSARAMDAAEEHRQFIDRWFYPCSHEMHVGLGEMYVADPRFAKNYEKLAVGLAAYVRDAIAANAVRNG